MGHDEMFNDDGFIIDEDMENNLSKGDESVTESSGDYMTEQAYHNDLHTDISIVERFSKYLKPIYVNLLHIIKPLEQHGSYQKGSKASKLTENGNNQIL